jgi:uncharacterized membrane protein HdeD (DUF308 family)
LAGFQILQSYIPTVSAKALTLALGIYFLMDGALKIEGSHMIMEVSGPPAELLPDLYSIN